MKKRLMQMGLVLAAVSMASAEVVVTAVSVQTVDGKKMAEVELNKALKIREIEVREVGGQISLKYPEYVTKSGRRYPDVEILDEAAEKVILKAIKSGKTETIAPKTKATYVVSDVFRLRNPKTRLGTVKMDFFGSVRVSFGVMKSNRPGSDPYWVAKPARPKKPGEKGRGNFIDRVDITNRALREAAFAEIIRKFKEQGSSGE